MADLEEVKRAYAQIMLNTTQESAVRVLASEQRAVLMAGAAAAAKRDAVSALVRLKNIMEAKIQESERRSFGHVKKIQELEIQLQEAQKTIELLQAELQRVTAELGQTGRKNVTSPMNEMDPSGSLDSEEKKSCGTSTSSSKSLPCTASGIFSPETNLLRQWTDKDSHYSHSASKERKSHETTLQFCSHDLASFLLRSNEPEHYRKGCTQRIRALEQNFVADSKLQSENSEQNFELESYRKVNSKRESVKKRRSPNVLQENSSTVYGNWMERTVRKTNNAVSAHLDVKRGIKKRPVDTKGGFFSAWRQIKFPKRKRNIRYQVSAADDVSTRTIMKPGSDSAGKMLNQINGITSSSCSWRVGGQGNVSDSEFEEKPKVSQSSTVSDLNPSSAEQRRHNLSAGDTAGAESISCGVKNEADLTVEDSRVEVKRKEESTIDSESVKHLKYTFTRRKKKAEPSENTLGSVCFEETKQNNIDGSGEIDAPASTSIASLLTGSPCSDSRMVQVAHQLVSLSANGW